MGFCVICVRTVLLSGALPLADITIYYMDIRAFGKGHEQFYQNAKAMGVEFVKAKVANIAEGDNGSVTIRYEDQEGGGVTMREHDLAVLALGILPEWRPEGICPVSTDADGFVKCAAPKIAPALTEMEGVFVAGVAAGPKDIVDSIVEAGAAASEACRRLAGGNVDAA